MAYVYRHIRDDKNEPFYIGIGSDDTYRRANERVGRNKYWNNIVKKTTYSVDIIFDFISWEDACKKEIEFIALYKRSCDGGTLSNLTKGGDGKLGVKPTNAFPKGHITHNKGKKMPQHLLEALIKINKGRPAHNKGVSPKKESVEKRKKTMELVGYKKGENHPMFGKTHSDELKARWRVTRKGATPWNLGVSMNVPHLNLIQEQKRVPVIQFSLSGEYIQEFASIADAGKAIGASRGNIWHCCEGTRKSCGGYVWKYKDMENNSMSL